MLPALTATAAVLPTRTRPYPDDPEIVRVEIVTGADELATATAVEPLLVPATVALSIWTAPPPVLLRLARLIALEPVVPVLATDAKVTPAAPTISPPPICSAVPVPLLIVLLA